MKCPFCNKVHRKKRTFQQCYLDAVWTRNHCIIAGTQPTQKALDDYNLAKELWEKLPE